MNRPADEAGRIREIAQRYDPLGAALLDDPYPFFAEAQAATPAFFSDRLQHWVITRHADVREVLRNTTLYSAANTLETLKPLCPFARQVLVEGAVRPPPALTNNDPPSHTRARRIANAAFTPRRVAQMEDFIRATTRRFIAERFKGGRADLIRDLAWELPALVIFNVIGLSDDEVHRIKAAAQNRLLFNWGFPTDEEQTELARDTVALWHFIQAFVKRRAEQPGEDFTSDLLRGRDESAGGLSQGEACSVLLALLVAGHETTTSLIGNAVRWLLRDRSHWDAVRQDPARLPNAIEEVLRIEPSIHTWRRRSLAPVRFGDVDIPAGANLLLLIGAANHDPTVFAEPDRFDIARTNAREHLSFGHGAHICLGAPLARLEARVVLEELGRAFPDLTIDPDWQMKVLPTLSFRGPAELPVSWNH
jgi:hypothetical protein